MVKMEKESEKNLMEDFYEGKQEVDYPETSLSSKIHALIKDITTLKIYSQQVSTLYLDTSQLPLHKLDRVHLQQAKELLLSLKELGKEYTQVKNDREDGEINYDKLS